MITENENFIKLIRILTLSDIHPTDCIKIIDLIISLSKEIEELKQTIKEVTCIPQDDILRSDD